MLPMIPPPLPSPPRAAPRRRSSRLALACAVAALLSACAAGPAYQRPAPPSGALPAAFKEGGPWQPASPALAEADGRWWARFGEAPLDDLVAAALQANQSLKQAEAQWRQAQALVPAAQAAGRPVLGLSAAESRSRSDSNGPLLRDSHAWAAQASWEPDLWGRVRRATEAAGASAQASAADVAAVRLALQAAVVGDVLQLRLDDRQLALYARTIDGDRKVLQVVRSQFRAGVATAADVALAEATLQTAEAQAIDLGLARRQLEHALAVLLGRAPADFTLPPWPETAPLPTPPRVPAGVPSGLLQRRPDIAAAERRVAAANANLGVAQSAWYPALTLSASGGNSGPGLGPWWATPYRVWALGAGLAATLFDGGARDAQNAQARAAFDAAAAGYRQTVLAAFQDVEDNLAALDQLARERAALEAATRSARTAERVALSQYRAGTGSYLALHTAQAQALADERAGLQVQARELAASVGLIKALGGGWDERRLAEPQPVAAAAPTPVEPQE